MLERQHSREQTRKQTLLRNMNKHGYFQKERAKRTLQRQRTTSSTDVNVNRVNSVHTVDVASNENEIVDNCRFRRLVQKHTCVPTARRDLIERFRNLVLNATTTTANSTTRLPSESDEQVDNYQPPDNIYYNKNISERIIKQEDFNLGEVLGSGGFGSVYMGQFKQQSVAIKVMHKYTKNPAAQLESFKAELRVMCFDHPNIVKTLAATHVDKFDEGAWVVMEYAGRSSLLGVINDPDQCISTSRRVKYASQIASALAYTHRNRVAHLDLKPANILITTDDDCKVGDFGCSQKVQFDIGDVSPTNRSMLTGTFAYRAPELLRGEPPTFKADIYSFGVTLWQLMFRENPYSNENQHVVIFGVVANGLRPFDPEPEEGADHTDVSYRALYQECWSACPLNRPPAHDIVDTINKWADDV